MDISLERTDVLVTLPMIFDNYQARGRSFGIACVKQRSFFKDIVGREDDTIFFFKIPKYFWKKLEDDIEIAFTHETIHLILKQLNIYGNLDPFLNNNYKLSKELGLL